MRITKYFECVVFSILFTISLANAATTTWTGGTSDDWFDDANWTGNHPDNGDEAIINSGTVLLTNQTAYMSAFTMNGGTLTFSNWTTRLSATNVALNAGTNTCAGPFTSYTNDYWPTFDESNRVAIACSNLTVAVGAAIDVSGKGYRGGTYVAGAYFRGHGPGGGAGNSGGGAGGTHGGGGGNTDRMPYGNYLCPVTPGSGGGTKYSNTSTPYGGAGGGAIEIVASGMVTVDGTIVANGGSAYIGKGGSGGSIYIRCNRLAGSEGSVSAAGSQPGGGGRVSVQYDPLVQSGYPIPDITFSVMSPLAVARTYDSASNGRIGTLCFPDNLFIESPIVHSGVWIATNSSASINFSSLEINNVWFQFQQDGLVLTVTNELRVCDEGRFELTNAMISCGSLAITNFGIVELYAGVTSGPGITVQGTTELIDESYLKICAGPTNGALPYGSLITMNGALDISDDSWIIPKSDPINGGSVKFNVGNVTVAETAGFDCTGLGYWFIAGIPYGPGAGGSWSGGGYGGEGGGNDGGITYGDSNAPVQCGSAGNGSYPYGNGNGGGLIWIDSQGTVEVDGVLTADGGDADKYANGGSGGGIYVICNRFGGSGSLSANGGEGGTDSRTGAGGGGRICIVRVLDLANSVTASATNGTQSLAGEPGTIVWIQPPPQGTFICIF